MEGVACDLSATRWSAGFRSNRSGGKMKCLKWGIGGFVLLAVIAAIAGGKSSDKPDSGSSSDSAGKTNQSSDSASTGQSAPKGCGTKATSDCTPHVGPDGHVRVDALIWRLKSARKAATLGDQTYGLGAKANGTFVIVKLGVKSDKDKSVTLTDSVVKLEVAGKTFDADIDGTTAAIGANEDPFLLESIGPESTVTGTVVFDVPDSRISKKLQLRFGELGFGDTKGYIRLPSL